MRACVVCVGDPIWSAPTAREYPAVAPLAGEVDLVLAIALAKERKRRFESAEELVHALQEACAGRIEPSLARRGEALIAEHPWRAEEKLRNP